MTTTTTTPDARLLQVTHKDGGRIRGDRITRDGNHIVRHFDTESAIWPVSIDVLIQDGWTIEPHPALKLWDSLHSPYSTRSYLRGWGIYATEGALANVSRVGGLIHGLRLTGNDHVADRLLIELHSALLCMTAKDVAEIEQGGMQIRALERKVLLTSEDDYSFGFQLYNLIGPEQWERIMAEAWKEAGDEALPTQVTDVAKRIARVFVTDNYELDMTHRHGWEQLHYRYVFNGGIICRFDPDSPEDFTREKWDSDRFAWSTHT